MGASREHRQRLYEQLVGTNVAGRFQITNLLGFGGMGAVYEAVQRNMQRSVALKIIPSHDPTTTARFEREALTISKLNHPNTVTVFDYGKTDQGLLFLAMEMLSGRTLSDLIEARRLLTPNEAVHIAAQVCRSLSEAHKSNIVHRDVKPDNIFLIQVDDDPHFVKVLDFGIAKIVQGEDNVELTGTGRIIGTPKYMSPEQILAEKIDHRSDIYSLACIVFEMLCGTPPFQETSTTKLMLAHAHQSPPTFSERLPNDALARIPGPLEQVVRKALSKSPSERQPDIDTFREELEAALAATDHQVRASAISPGATQIQPAAAHRSELTDSSDLLAQHSSQTLAQLRPPTGLQNQPSAPVGPPPTVAKSTKNKRPLIAIGAVLVVLAALGTYAVLRPGSPPEPAPTPAQAPPPVAPKPQPVAKQQEPKTQAPPADKPSAPAKVEVRVLTEPDGAQVYEQGRYLGKTPMTIKAKPGSTLAYSFELDGYKDKKASYDIDPDEPAPLFVVSLDKKERPKRTHHASRPSRSHSSNTKPTKSDDSDSTATKPKKPLVPKIDKIDDDTPKVNRL